MENMEMRYRDPNRPLTEEEVKVWMAEMTARWDNFFAQLLEPTATNPTSENDTPASGVHSETGKQ